MHDVGSARRLASEGYLSHVRNGGLGGLAWSRLSLRCTIGRDSLGPAQHDPRGCFDLSRSRSLLRGDDGMDIASMDPQTVLA